MSVKMTKQYIFIIENSLQKVGQSFFHLSRQTTMIKDLLVQRQFSLVSDKRYYYMTSDNVFSDWLTPLVTFFDKTL
jgi:galactose-1-phosphate uridylyltransferase